MTPALRTILLGGLDPDALAWSKTVTVSSTRLGLVSSTIRALKNAGLWQSLDRLTVLAGENAMQGRTCWKSRVVASPSNGPTFTANRGYAGDGISSYLDSNFTASTQGVNYTLNSASLFLYSNTNRAAANTDSMGGQDAGLVATFLDMRNAAGSALGTVHNTFAAGNITAAVSDTLGLFTLSRTASNLTALYKRGTSVGTTATASSAIANFSSAISAFNNNGSIVFSGETARFAAFGFAAGLSAAQVTTFNAILEANYLTPVGANA